MPSNLPHNPWDVVRLFEANVAVYTGAPFCVAVESCTTALYLGCALFKDQGGRWRDPISIPSQTYLGVPQSIMNAGYGVLFREENWSGVYQLKPLPLWDCARRFTRKMYVPGQHQCLSFHWEKILGVGRGGAILTDDPVAAAWYRRARFDGRTEGVCCKDEVPQWGLHATMTPEMAAAGLGKLYYLPDVNPDQPGEYPDLSRMARFQEAGCLSSL
jgi:dTDP-4-amino-4,6-dideoxygalactose transaminase